MVKSIVRIKNDFFNYQEKEDNWSKDTKQLAERTFNILELFFKETNLRDITNELVEGWTSTKFYQPLYLNPLKILPHLDHDKIL